MGVMNDASIHKALTARDHQLLICLSYLALVLPFCFVPMLAMMGALFTLPLLLFFVAFVSFKKEYAEKNLRLFFIFIPCVVYAYFVAVSIIFIGGINVIALLISFVAALASLISVSIYYHLVKRLLGKAGVILRKNERVKTTHVFFMYALLLVFSFFATSSLDWLLHPELAEERNRIERQIENTLAPGEQISVAELGQRQWTDICTVSYELKGMDVADAQDVVDQFSHNEHITVLNNYYSELKNNRNGIVFINFDNHTALGISLSDDYKVNEYTCLPAKNTKIIRQKDGSISLHNEEDVQKKRLP